MAYLPAILAAAFLIANVIAWIDFDLRRAEAKDAAEAARMRAIRFARRAQTIATLERFAAGAEARGWTIDARNYRNRIARIAAWQSADEAY